MGHFVLSACVGMIPDHLVDAETAEELWGDEDAQ